MVARHFLAAMVAVAALLFVAQTGQADDVRPASGQFYKIDPNTPDKDLLPMPPRVAPKLPGVLNEDLALVPELALSEPIGGVLFTETVMEYHMAKINHLNAKQEDGFVRTLLAHRADLRGLPFLMGKACRTEMKPAQLFAEVVNLVHETGGPANEGFNRRALLRNPESYWREFDRSWTNGPNSKYRCAVPEKDAERAKIAAHMQVFGAKDSNFQASLAKQLTAIKHPDATQALAKLALYAPVDSVRSAAIDGLKSRPKEEYVSTLMAGFRYPLPAVSQHAADALVKLNCKEMLADLVSVLEQPDPRAPVKQAVDGKEATVVRELVRVNHHRNCLMCHAPANTSDVPADVLTVPVPLPGQSFEPSGGYNGPTQPSKDIFVRIDMTYLRQDFSMMMPVGNASPWPAMQRFDFLVRTRVLTPEQAADCVKELAGATPPNHRAAQSALRQLSGQTPESGTPQEWRRLLKL